jgi:thiamine biosynthesis lipoprotein
MASATGLTEVRLALEAMATRFELVIVGSDPTWLRAAGEEALAEIALLEEQLSFYRSSSEITWINAHAAGEPVRVEPALFRLLQRCLALSVATEGAFDVTVGPLMRAWRFAGGEGAVPDDSALADARDATGYAHLNLDDEQVTVGFARRGMSIDLGAAGKGFAIDRAIDVLRGLGVERALLQGGTSSVHALGPPPDAPGWRVSWRRPDGAQQTFDLCNAALSVSAVHGRIFEADGERYGHVMDPRTGMPTRAALSAVVTGPGSLECDALSTALLVRGPAWIASLREQFPGYNGAVAG